MIRSHFVKETKRKKMELEELRIVIQTSKEKMEEGMKGSIRGDIIYDKIEDILTKINLLKLECNDAIEGYKDEDEYY